MGVDVYKYAGDVGQLEARIKELEALLREALALGLAHPEWSAKAHALLSTQPPVM